MYTIMLKNDMFNLLCLGFSEITHDVLQHTTHKSMLLDKNPQKSTWNLQPF